MKRDERKKGGEEGVTVRRREKDEHGNGRMEEVNKERKDRNKVREGKEKGKEGR